MAGGRQICSLHACTPMRRDASAAEASLPQLGHHCLSENTPRAIGFGLMGRMCHAGEELSLLAVAEGSSHSHRLMASSMCFMHAAVSAISKPAAA
jgi:hypothetical protein